MSPPADSVDADTRPGSWPRRPSPLPRWQNVWQIAVVIVSLAALMLVLPRLLDLKTAPPPLSVTLRIDGRDTPLRTQSATVAGLLQEQRLTLDSSDLILPALETPLQPNMLIEIVRARLVALRVDGMTRVLRTSFETPDDILASAGITLAPADQILLDGTRVEASRLATWPIPVLEIEIIRGVEMTIRDGSTVTALRTTRTTVAEALFEAGVTLFLADVVTPAVNTPVYNGLEIVIQRAVPVTVLVDGARTETRTTASTVLAVLAEAGITLIGLDMAVPSAHDPVIAGMVIRVIRVREARITEEERLPFETRFQADPALPLDERRTVQAGREGQQVREFIVRYENEIEISRTLSEETLVSAPVDQIIHYGTNIVLSTLDTPNGPVQYWRRLRLYATSYHPEALGGDNITATGRLLERGVVSIDPRLIPYDTTLYVVGYGVGVAADTGAPRSHSYWIDLGYSDADFEHWARWVDVYLLTPVPENVQYLLPPHPHDR